MKTNSNPESFTEKIRSGIKKAQAEIEEFALQFALGKAVAGEKFEELKKDFMGKTSLWKQRIAALKTGNEKEMELLKSKIEALQVQLALGKADAKDFFIVQKKKILDSVHEIESGLKRNPLAKELQREISHEIEKFKLKLEILELQFELKTFTSKEKLKDAMGAAEIEIEKLFKKIDEKWDEAKSKKTDFAEEISKSFEHLKKAVKSL